MGKTVVGEMLMIWLAWKVMNVILSWLVVKLPVPAGVRAAVIGG